MPNYHDHCGGIMKPKYEKPFAMPLRESVKGSGQCNAGSAVMPGAYGSDCINGSFPGMGCYPGSGANYGCGSGTGTQNNCTSGINPYGNCWTGGIVTRSCGTGYNPA